MQLRMALGELGFAKDKERAPGCQFAEVKNRDISKEDVWALNVDEKSKMYQICKRKL